MVNHCTRQRKDWRQQTASALSRTSSTTVYREWRVTATDQYHQQRVTGAALRERLKATPNRGGYSFGRRRRRHASLQSDTPNEPFPHDQFFTLRQWLHCADRR